MPAPNAPSAVAGPQTIQNPTLFQQLTERQEMPQNPVNFPGLAKKSRIEIEKVGVIARARLIVNLKFKTHAEGVATLLPGWPWKLIRSVALQSNGVTGILNARGTTYQMRRERIYRNPVRTVEEAPAIGALEKNKSYSVRFLIEIPIAHDMLSLLGCLLAQNEQTQLALEIVWAAENEMLSYTEGKTLTSIEGTLEWATTTFAIGETTEGNKTVTVLPDLSAFHGLLDESVPIVGSGEKKAPLIRTAGQLLAYTLTVMNGETAQISPTAWSQFTLEYGGNKKPIVFQPPYNLLSENEDDYNGALSPGGVTYLCIDNEKDNPTRDLWIPEALVELRSSTTIPAAVEVKEGAYLLYTQETLYPSS
ncbi:MAG TPA: hypothetical protein VNY31_10415 [Solirubrobacteraceae bacterium]|jgi:hypothetical protein|nr:hypothetical protein [Solirubrobacteraceae bacterium]